MPLLNASDDARIINVSSARASVTLQTTGKLPPTASIPYSISKTALNILTLELSKLHENIKFYSVSPGHCRTELNDFTGSKDPLDGAKVIVDLVTSNRDEYEAGFWQHEGGKMSQVGW
jgi:NAD(P)-dependent dehydrogenase (short-subunit alcohol dehydrogenase family)